MNLWKTISSSIILAVFAFFSGFCVFCTLEGSDFARVFGLSQPVLICGIGIYLLFTIAVFAALRTIFAEVLKHIKDKKRAGKALGVVLPVLTLLGIAVYLIFYLMNQIPVALKDDTFYRLALVREGSMDAGSQYGVSRLYVLLLHGMLLLFGNMPFAGVVLQIILFFFCLVFLYTGMQAYAGAFPAAVTTAAFGFFPVSIEYVFSLTPELLYLGLYLLGFCLTGLLYRQFCKPGASFSLLYILLLFVGGYAALFSLSEIPLFAGGRAGWEHFVFRPDDILRMFRMPDNTGIAFLLVVTSAFFIVPAFLLQKKSQNNAFVLNLFLLYGLYYLGTDGPWWQAALLSGWCMAAGLGFYEIVRPPEKTLRKKSKKSDKEENSDMADTEKQVTEEQEQKKPAPGEPLPNPLPVPKRKNRAQADFAYQVAEADMKFDIEAAESDDFDV